MLLLFKCTQELVISLVLHFFLTCCGFSFLRISLKFLQWGPENKLVFFLKVSIKKREGNWLCLHCCFRLWSSAQWEQRLLSSDLCCHGEVTCQSVTSLRIRCSPLWLLLRTYLSVLLLLYVDFLFTLLDSGGPLQSLDFMSTGKLSLNSIPLPASSQLLVPGYQICIF